MRESMPAMSPSSSREYGGVLVRATESTPSFTVSTPVVGSQSSATVDSPALEQPVSTSAAAAVSTPRLRTLFFIVSPLVGVRVLLCDVGSSEVLAEALLEVLHQPATGHGDDEVEDSGEGEHLEVLEGGCTDRVSLAQELRQAQREGEGADLQDEDREAHEGGQRDAEALRDQDEAHDVAPLEPQRVSRFEFALRHGAQAGTDDLTRVCRGREAERDDGGGEGIQYHAGLRQPEVDHLEHDERGHPSPDLDDDDREPAHDRVPGRGHEGEHETDRDADHEGEHRDLHAHPEPGEQAGQPFDPVSQQFHGHALLPKLSFFSSQRKSAASGVPRAM